jgi:hypothetical protein
MKRTKILLNQTSQFLLKTGNKMLSTLITSNQDYIAGPKPGETTKSHFTSKAFYFMFISKNLYLVAFNSIY